MRLSPVIAGCLLLILAALPVSAADEPDDLVVDLSEHDVSVTVDFAGADLVLFGATEGVGDVIVEVRGPIRSEAVRRKERIAGIWLNRDSMVFHRVPAFYALASSRPLKDIVSDDALATLQIGVNNLWLIPDHTAEESEIAEFRAALVRNKQAVGLFPAEPDEVKFRGDRLFRADIHFPANVMVGPYEIKVHLVESGKVVRSTRTPLTLSRVGFEAGIYRLAHRWSLAYGILAIVVAVMAGWLANLFFRSKA